MVSYWSRSVKQLKNTTWLLVLNPPPPKTERERNKTSAMVISYNKKVMGNGISDLRNFVATATVWLPTNSFNSLWLICG